jgi:MinD superfamily P-loop ATPase
MKETEMTSQEHTVAVVEPTLDGEASIEIARQAVNRGARATVVVLINRKTMEDVSAFATSENLRLPDAEGIYMERLAEAYSTRFGGHDKVTIITDGRRANRTVFEAAARDAATSIVMPQRLVNRRNWKSSVAKSQIPVLIAPPRAA